MARLTGLDIANASLYEGATAVAEAVLMALHHSDKRRVLVASTLHPDYRAVPSRRKMASVPEGVQLLMEPSLPIPVLLVENVYIFPGIPQLFRRKFDSIKERFRDLPYFGLKVYVTVRESSFAHLLDTLVREFPDLMLGSYPEVQNPEYRVKLTLESKDADYLTRAYERLLVLFPPDYICRVE